MPRLGSLRPARILLSTLAALLTFSIPAPEAHARSHPQGVWRLLDVGSTRPGPRRHSTMVYDAANQRAILFGGDRMTTDMAVFNDLWSLDLSNPDAPHWVLLQAQDGTIPDNSSVRPSPRHGQVAAVVPGTPNRMFMHGGKGVPGARLDDTWQLTLGATPAWTRRSTGISAAMDRYHHTAAYVGGTFRIFGGKEMLDIGMADTWQMSVATYSWSFVSGNKTASGPSCTWENPHRTCPNPSDIPERRYYHSLIVDPVSNGLITFGGVYNTDPGVASNVWKSTNGGTSWTKLGVADPGMGRYFHTATYDPIGQRMVVIGGYDSEVIDQMTEEPGGPETRGTVQAYTLPLTGSGAWSALTPSCAGPGPIAEHCAVYDPVRDRILVFGGVDENGNYRDDVWALEFNCTDVTSPATVADFAAQSYGGGTITFGWTAPGDDGMTGRACSYEIRYSTQPITDAASFAAATLWGAPPVPAASGQAQTVTIGSLVPSSVYYVALKARDGCGNASGISNVVCARINLPHVMCDGGGFAPPADEQGAATGRFEFALRAPHPNPTSGPLDVSFALARRGSVTLELLDVAGRRVSGLDFPSLEAGEHHARLATGLALAPGYYLVRLSQAGAMLTRPLLIVR